MVNGIFGPTLIQAFVGGFEKVRVDVMDVLIDRDK